MIIHGDIKKDIFDTSYITQPESANAMRDKVHSTEIGTWTFFDMGELYELLTKYDALCLDLKNCHSEYTQRVLRNEMASLGEKIHGYFVCNTKGGR